MESAVRIGAVLEQLTTDIDRADADSVSQQVRRNVGIGSMRHKQSDDVQCCTARCKLVPFFWIWQEHEQWWHLAGAAPVDPLLEHGLMPGYQLLYNQAVLIRQWLYATCDNKQRSFSVVIEEHDVTAWVIQYRSHCYVGCMTGVVQSRPSVSLLRIDIRAYK